MPEYKIGKVKIISDGNAMNTQVLDPDGRDMCKYLAVKSILIQAGEPMSVTMRLCEAEFEIAAEAKVQLSDHALKVIEALGYVKKEEVDALLEDFEELRPKYCNLCNQDEDGNGECKCTR